LKKRREVEYWRRKGREIAEEEEKKCRKKLISKTIF